jgi:hypothetical protein
MVNGKLLNFLDKELGIGDQSDHGEVKYYCPFCNHYKKKLQVNLDINNTIRFGKWHCWVCNAKGNNILTLVKKINNNDKVINKLHRILSELKVDHTINYQMVADNVNSIIKLPNEFISLSKPSNSIEYKNAFKYVTNVRGLSIGDIINYNLGYCELGEYARRIIIPSYDSNNILNYFVSRYYYEYENVFSNYKNPPYSKDIVVFENKINWLEPIILVEGVFDAITLKRNTIPLLGKTIQSTLFERILTKKPPLIYIALDNDALESSILLAEQLINIGVTTKLIVLPNKDPSTLGYNKCIDLLSTAIPINNMNLFEFKLKLNINDRSSHKIKYSNINSIK